MGRSTARDERGKRPDRVVVSVSFPKDDLAGVARFAAGRNETISEVIRRAVSAYLERTDSAATITPTSTGDWTLLSGSPSAATISVGKSASLGRPKEQVEARR